MDAAKRLSLSLLRLKIMPFLYRFMAKASAFVLMFGFLAACSAKKDSGNANVTQENFQVIQPMLLDTVYHQAFVADIQSIQRVELRAQVKGYLDKIYIDEGQTVKQGQLLFSISSPAFREELLRANAALKNAQAEAKVAEVELKNTQILVSKNIVGKTELEMAEAKVEAAEAKVEEAKTAVSSAKLSLSFTQIKAPFSGIINREPNKVGSLIEEGTLLTTLSNPNEVYAYFNLSEKEYLDFVSKKSDRMAQKVLLQLANGEMYSHTGVVETAESEIDQNTGNIAFRARFVNPQGLLKHGSSGKILVSNAVKNALAIPQKSTFEIQENLYVFVVDEQNKVQMRSFVPKLRLPHLYIVDSGLKPTDRILYEGIQRVKEGDIIQSELVQMRQVMTQLALR